MLVDEMDENGPIIKIEMPVNKENSDAEYDVIVGVAIPDETPWEKAFRERDEAVQKFVDAFTKEVIEPILGILTRVKNRLKQPS